MSIPLDRLYHYIESVASNACKSNIVIYRFFPHGSKKFKDLTQTQNHGWFDVRVLPQVFCHDQEPLNYSLYQHIDFANESVPPKQGLSILDHFQMDGVEYPQQNLRSVQLNGMFNIYDQAVLLHSELRSNEVEKYAQDQYVPAYYWSHALLARDWFRYAEHDCVLNHKNSNKTFLIYNRAWTGTREYRLKFSDLLIDYQLLDRCQTSCNIHDPDSGLSYQQHRFVNPDFVPNNLLENYYSFNSTGSWMSADFDSQDYASTDIEIVLETLFDDQRLHLTEKSLRPMACGQPFLLAATAGSLEYLRSYGFQTFNGIIDESYDTIKNPAQRLEAIVQVMKTISQWSPEQYCQKLDQMRQIARSNQQHFFSDNFFNQVVAELKENLTQALNTVINTNTGQRCLNLRKNLCQYPAIREFMITNDPARTRNDIMQYLKLARSFGKTINNK